MTDDSIIEFLKEDVKKYETPERYAHTLGVMRECEYLASKLGFSEDDARALRVAALCHDITKDISREDHRALCVRHGIPYNPTPVLHQDTAAAFVSEKYADIPSICDKRVLSAISKHTTGGENMSVCDTALFVADFTEEGREYEDCVKMREYIHAECEKINKKDKSAAKRLLCSAVIVICEKTIAHLRQKNAKTDARTEETLFCMRSIRSEN